MRGRSKHKHSCDTVVRNNVQAFASLKEANNTRRLRAGKPELRNSLAALTPITKMVDSVNDASRNLAAHMLNLHNQTYVTTDCVTLRNMADQNCLCVKSRSLDQNLGGRITSSASGSRIKSAQHKFTLATDRVLNTGFLAGKVAGLTHSQQSANPSACARSQAIT